MIKMLIDEYGMSEQEAKEFYQSWLTRKTFKDEMIEREENGYENEE